MLIKQEHELGRVSGSGNVWVTINLFWIFRTQRFVDVNYLSYISR
jgi:hypothetical protein